MNDQSLPGATGRRYIRDDRDHSFPLSAVLTQEPSDRSWRYWYPNAWWGNQGLEPHCVAYAWTHWLEDGPITHTSTPDGGLQSIVDTSDLYNRAQALDGWPGTDYAGTSVRAGAKALVEKGLVESYRWAWDVDTIVHSLLTAGPVVFGSLWMSGMSYPDSGGFLRLTGSEIGGHAYVLNGVNTGQGKVRMKNSWGRHWGIRGHAWIGFEDLDVLLNRNGEACMALEIDSDQVAQ